MNTADVLDVTREAIAVTLKIGGPVMIIALVVGLVVSLLQALTQIQESTLAFVPKLIVIMVSLMLLLPFMLGQLTTFTRGIAARIASGSIG
ncbi:MAG TPA: flagellar biosynthesis protein FliQ [Alphaproteobacteria bacterium]|jgi:flagellar biosynthetic protein FliQ|nr:flagellar biosynthesis protein FliQ [Alphaproteobacteria bacterium]